MNITDTWLRARSGKRQERDSEHRIGDGLTVTVRKTGVVSFLFIYIREGKKRKITLGRYPTTRLKAAKKLHEELLTELKAKRDPWLLAQQNKRATAAALQEAENEKELGTAGQLFSIYCDDLEADGKRSADDYRGMYDRDINDVIGHKKARDVTSDDIADIVAMISNRGAKTAANNTRAALHAAFEFGMKIRQKPRWRGKAPNFGITSNPATGVEKARKGVGRRDRYLDKEELFNVWNALDAPWTANDKGATKTYHMSIEAKTALRLLISTGQRIEEILHAEWSEFDLDEMLWTMPGERRKTRHKTSEPHLVPLTEFHEGLLNELREAQKDDNGKVSTSKWLFPRKDGKGPRSHNANSQTVRKLIKRQKLEPWQSRDIRRSVKTLMGSIGISLELRNRLQGHALTDVGSVAYDRYDYLTEKRDAMTLWTEWLERLFNGTGNNVVELRA